MRCDRKTMRLYAVTDRAWVGKGTLRDQVELALRGGVTCVQLREKSLEAPAILAEAEEIGALCRSYGVPFLINDCVEIALRCGADGVHVGQKDRPAREVRRLLGPDRILGVSARTVEQAVQAERDGADYLGVGAVFSTSTKQDAMPVSYETVQAISRAVSIPVVAIGGIQKENLLSLAGSGVDGVALVSAIFAAPDVEAACRELRVLSETMVRGAMIHASRKGPEI